MPSRNRHHFFLENCVKKLALEKTASIQVENNVPPWKILQKLLKILYYLKITWLISIRGISSGLAFGLKREKMLNNGGKH